MTLCEFNRKLENWLNVQGVSNAECAPAIDFQYGVDDYTVYYSLFEKEDDPDNICFKQFLYEYGLEEEVGNWIVSFLHEAGHHMTIHQFDELDMDVYQTNRAFLLNTMDAGYERSSMYWETAIEFEANMWAIDFIQTHMEAVIELCMICKEFFGGIGEAELEEIYDALCEVDV